MTATTPRMLFPFHHLLAGGLASLAPFAALAHHAHDYAPPATVWQALASGLAHPLLSGPHLVALLALGMLAAARSQGGAMLLAFCSGSALTAMAFAAGSGGWPAHDLWVAATLALAAAGLWRARANAGPSQLVILLLALLAGSIHGQIAAESIATDNATLLASYWVGIVIAQLALGAAVLIGLRRLSATREALAGKVQRTAAALSAGAACGVFFALI